MNSRPLSTRGLDGFGRGEIVLSHLADRVVNDPSDVEGVEDPATSLRCPIVKLDPSKTSPSKNPAREGKSEIFREITMICGLG